MDQIVFVDLDDVIASDGIFEGLIAVDFDGVIVLDFVVDIDGEIVLDFVGDIVGEIVLDSIVVLGCLTIVFVP